MGGGVVMAVKPASLRSFEERPSAPIHGELRAYFVPAVAPLVAYAAHCVFFVYQLLHICAE